MCGFGGRATQKLPDLIDGRRRNGKLVQQKLNDHPRFMIQQEIGKSSWFGFSLLLRDPLAGSRPQLVKELIEEGFEVRPIATGNFANSEAMKYFDYVIHDKLKNQIMSMPMDCLLAIITIVLPMQLTF